MVFSDRKLSVTVGDNQKHFVWLNFRSIQKNIVLIENALRGDLVIPEFSQLTKPIEEIYNKCKENKEGKVMLQYVKILSVHWNHVHSENV